MFIDKFLYSKILEYVGNMEGVFILLLNITKCY